MRAIVLPGLDGTGRMLAGFARRLGARCEVDIVAYPGDQTLSYAELAELVVRRLPSDERFVLIAESFSGPVATLVAQSRPEGLAGIVFAASFVRAPRRLPASVTGLTRYLPFKSRALLRLAAPVTNGRWPDVEGAGLAQAIADVDRVVLADRLTQALRADHAPEFARLTVPMLYLRPRQDLLVPRSAAKAMAQSNPRLTVAELDGPHFVLQTRPAETAAMVGEFIATLV